MPNPFPGMNPYLEQPEFWSDFHNQIIASLARELIPKLLPKYRVVTDEWIYRVTDAGAIAIGRPDVSIQQRRPTATEGQSTAPARVRQAPSLAQPVKVTLLLPEELQQSYLEVRDAVTQKVVTTVEVLSPANKRGEGRQKYEAKRQQLLTSSTHLVEIDLLRGGDPLPMENGTLQSHYRILVSRAQTRPVADLYPFNLGDRIPPFPLPLLPGDPEPTIDLQSLVNDLHEQLAYDYFMDYRTRPPLPWSDADVVNWVQPYR